MVQLVTLIQVGHCHVKHVWCVILYWEGAVSELIKIILFQLKARTLVIFHEQMLIF